MAAETATTLRNCSKSYLSVTIRSTQKPPRELEVNGHVDGSKLKIQRTTDVTLR